ncbi:tripartite motif-containing protein 16-like isoform X2 [Paralichthys olivaceus]|uniref:tripartite motif-containing protein 16-like isoform X2 n=1 Tax=Paralichthys olivaceus TaxID=8255 RepID=UPI00097D22AA|nr:PREDICTED: tripartite motif-containing protein 16-like isoform X2 [Paralichthys olivaceus]
MAMLCSNKENLKDIQHNTNIKEETEQPTLEMCETVVPQDVPCDSCMDSPSKATKSCLTCLVSYCEAHLRPHLENTKFQNHRLVDPLHDVDCRFCEVHRLPLERFCLVDGCCVCPDCESQEHEGHTIAPVGEARTQIETEMQKKQKEINQNTSAAGKTIEKLQSNNDLIKASVQEVCVFVEQQFASVQAAVKEARKEVMEVLEEEQRRALRQADGIQAHLEQRRTELLKNLAQINKMSKIKSDVDFLQEYSEWRKGASDVGLPSVHINRMDHLSSYVQVLTDPTQELCDVILSSYRDQLSMFFKGTKSLRPESQSPSLADPETRDDFVKYTISLTFDPDTAHHFLRVTEDNRKLTNTSPWQHSYPDHHDRFEYWRQALTSQSIYLGRHYVEAELSGEGAHVGVTYKSIERKGEHSTCCITGNDFSWCLGRNSQGFFAWHAGLETALEVTEVKRIGLYVDFHKGSVSFYDVSGPMKLLHRYQADFIEPLYVIVWLSKKDNVVCLVNAE